VLRSAATAATGAPPTTTPSISGKRGVLRLAKELPSPSARTWTARERDPDRRRLNGTAWKSVNGAAAQGAGGLNGVSCKRASCLAVGYYSTTSGIYPDRTLMERQVADPAAAPPHWPAGALDASLGDVSCVTATSCVLIGSATTSASRPRIVVDTWNGTK